MKTDKCETPTRLIHIVAEWLETHHPHYYALTAYIDLKNPRQSREQIEEGLEMLKPHYDFSSRGGILCQCIIDERRNLHGTSVMPPHRGVSSWIFNEFVEVSTDYTHPGGTSKIQIMAASPTFFEELKLHLPITCPSHVKLL